LNGEARDGQSEAEQPDHPASSGDSITASRSDEVFGTHILWAASLSVRIGYAPGH
jgi:hypothetical protein